MTGLWEGDGFQFLREERWFVGLGEGVRNDGAAFCDGGALLTFSAGEAAPIERTFAYSKALQMPPCMVAVYHPDHTSTSGSPLVHTSIPMTECLAQEVRVV